MRLALLRLSALGDILRVLPAWVNLHRAFPQARLQAVVESRHVDLLKPFPFFEPVPVDRRSLQRPWTAWAEFRRVAQQIQGADVSLDFHGILKSSLIPQIAGVPERWGDGVTKEGAAWLQTHRLMQTPKSRYRQALDLAEAFGQSRGQPGLGRFVPVLKDWVQSKPESLGKTSRPIVVLVPGTSRAGIHKRWPLDHWLNLHEELKTSVDLRWCLGPEETVLRAHLTLNSSLNLLPPLGFWELASLLRAADHVVVGDTGILHLSLLLGTPVTLLLGPSDPLISAPPEEADAQVLRTGISCSPCREKRCLRRQCMTELPAEQVAEAVMRSLEHRALI